MTSAIRTTARVKRHFSSSPSAEIVMWQTIAARSSPDLSEQTSAERTSGSIGITRSGK
tara:strand:- start:2035 stop:2208 length:174 start_codon:yes stop_codon:yes gene_type:complete